MNLFKNLEQHVQDFFNTRGVFSLNMSDSLAELLSSNDSLIYYTENEPVSFRICSCGVYVQNTFENNVCPICITKAKSKKLTKKEFDSKTFKYKNYYLFTVKDNQFIYEEGIPTLSLEQENNDYTLKIISIKGDKKVFDIEANGMHLKNEKLLKFLVSLSKTKFVEAINTLNNLLEDEYKMPLTKMDDYESVETALIYYSIKELRIIKRKYPNNKSFNKSFIMSDKENMKFSAINVINNIMNDNYFLNPEYLSNGNEIHEILNINKSIANLLDKEYLDLSINSLINEKELLTKLHFILDDLLYDYLLEDGLDLKQNMVFYIENIIKLIDDYNYDKNELLAYMEKVKNSENISYNEIVVKLCDYYKHNSFIVKNQVNNEDIKQYPKNILIDTKLKEKEKEDFSKEILEKYLDVIYNDLNISYEYKKGNIRTIKPTIELLENEYNEFFEDNYLYSNIKIKDYMVDKLGNNEKLFYFIKDFNEPEVLIVIEIDLEINKTKIIFKKTKGFSKQYSSNISDDLNLFLTNFAGKFKINFNKENTSF